MRSWKTSPPSEWDYKDNVQEFTVAARCVQETDARSQIEVTFSNSTILPPRYIDDAKVRYYFDIAEMVKAGQSIDDLTVEIYYDEESANSDGVTHANLSEPIPYGDSGTTYYVEISWENCVFYGEHVFHFALIAEMDENYEVNWDPSNDYSRPGLPEPDVEIPELTDWITAYVDGELVWGMEPEDAKTTVVTTEMTAAMTTASVETTTVSSSEKPIPGTTHSSTEDFVLYGDVNLDGKVDLSDVVLLNRSVSGSVQLNDLAKKNADCDGTSGISAGDSLAILCFLVHLEDKLPIS